MAGENGRVHNHVFGAIFHTLERAENCAKKIADKNIIVKFQSLSREEAKALAQDEWFSDEDVGPVYAVLSDNCFHTMLEIVKEKENGG